MPSRARNKRRNGRNRLPGFAQNDIGLLQAQFSGNGGDAFSNMFARYHE